MLHLPQRPSRPATSPYEKLGLRDLPFATQPVIDPNSIDPRRNGKIFATSSVKAEIEKFEYLLIRPQDFGNRVKLASLWAKGQAYQGRGMGKTALLRYFQRRINPDLGLRRIQRPIFRCGRLRGVSRLDRPTLDGTAGVGSINRYLREWRFNRFASIVAAGCDDRR